MTVFEAAVHACIQHRYYIPRMLFLLAVTAALLCASPRGQTAIAALLAAFAVWLYKGLPGSGDGAAHAPKRRYGVASNKYSEGKVPQDLDAVVIGSGAGGLTCAAVLSQMGWRVLVLEAHQTVAGGGTHEFALGKARDHFRFDAGLHYTVPWSDWLLRLCCAGRSKAPCFRAMDDGDGTFDRVVLGGAAPFRIKAGEAHLPDLRRLFPHDGPAIDNWIRLTDRAMLGVAMHLVFVALPEPLARAWRRLVMSGPLWKQSALRTAEEVMRRDLGAKDPRLVAMLMGQWIDTGVAPTCGSFLLAAAVNRGFPLEGAVFPEGGSSAIAEALVPVVEATGGRCLIQAKVGRILVDSGPPKGGVETPKGGAARAEGVEVRGHAIRARHVISACGYRTTAELAAHPSLPPLPEVVRQSDGFLMVNIGIEGGAEELQVPVSNLWVHPLRPDGSEDLFDLIRRFEADPEGSDPPMMITFPSLKDKAWPHKDRMTCQILVLAKLQWFGSPGEHGGRSATYIALKKRWEQRCVAVLLRHYPQLEGRLSLVDVSTPASIAHWLAARGGAATGLECVPARFRDDVQALLRMETGVAGLWLTGQDTFICGVPMAQIAGLVTALRVAGLRATLAFFARHARMLLRALLLLQPT